MSHLPDVPGLTTEQIDRAIEAWFDSDRLDFGDYQKFRQRMEAAIRAACNTRPEVSRED